MLLHKAIIIVQHQDTCVSALLVVSSNQKIQRNCNQVGTYLNGMVLLSRSSIVFMTFTNLMVIKPSSVTFSSQRVMMHLVTLKAQLLRQCSYMRKLQAKSLTLTQKSKDHRSLEWKLKMDKCSELFYNKILISYNC